MGNIGFAIQCPHCGRWSVWPNVDPESMAIKSIEEVRNILKDLTVGTDDRLGAMLSHPKLLHCTQSRSRCPTSFQAFVCRSEKTAYEILSLVPHWAFKRDFRLYRADCRSRWGNNYYGVMFATQPVQRIRNIELESLIDSNLLSRMILGIGVELQAPLTVYAARGILNGAIAGTSSIQ